MWWCGCGTYQGRRRLLLVAAVLRQRRGHLSQHGLLFVDRLLGSAREADALADRCAMLANLGPECVEVNTFWSHRKTVISRREIDGVEDAGVQLDDDRKGLVDVDPRRDGAGVVQVGRDDIPVPSHPRGPDRRGAVQGRVVLVKVTCEVPLDELLEHEMERVANPVARVAQLSGGPELARCVDREEGDAGERDRPQGAGDELDEVEPLDHGRGRLPVGVQVEHRVEAGDGVRVKEIERRAVDGLADLVHATRLSRCEEHEPLRGGAEVGAEVGAESIRGQPGVAQLRSRRVRDRERGGRHLWGVERHGIGVEVSGSCASGPWARDAARASVVRTFEIYMLVIMSMR